MILNVNFGFLEVDRVLFFSFFFSFFSISSSFFVFVLFKVIHSLTHFVFSL